MKRLWMLPTVFLGGCLTSCGPAEWRMSDVQYEGRVGLQLEFGGFEAYIGLPGEIRAKGEASGETEAVVDDLSTPEPEGG